MFKFFDRIIHKSTVEIPHYPVDTARLDESLQLLRTTTVEVSEAAISAARVLEDRLHDSNMRFLSTIDAISDLVIVKDELGRWQTVNTVGQRVFGWSHGEYYQRTDEELAERYPQFKECLTTCTKTDRAAWATRKSSQSEEHIPDGTAEYIFDIIKTPIYNTDGSRKELIVVGRDVTAAREKERRMKVCFTALNSASDIIFIVDNLGKIFFCNDKFVQAFHLESYNQVVDKYVEDALPFTIPNRKEMWARVTSNHVWEQVICPKYKMTILPMMNGAPEPIFYICTLKQISFTACTPEDCAQCQLNIH